MWRTWAGRTSPPPAGHSSPCWRSSRWISWKEGRCLVSRLQQLSMSLYTESGHMAGWGRYIFGSKETGKGSVRKRGCQVHVTEELTPGGERIATHGRPAPRGNVQLGPVSPRCLSQYKKTENKRAGEEEPLFPHRWVCPLPTALNLKLNRVWCPSQPAWVASLHCSAHRPRPSLKPRPELQPGPPRGSAASQV